MKFWNPEYKTLEHWRGLAALWVMIFHGFGAIYHISLHPFLELLKSVAAPGWLGVHLFFVISGYCISASVYKLILKKNGNVWSFIRNRAWRLLPVYWIAFLVTIAFNFISSLFNKTSLWENLPSSWQGWIGNLFLIQPYLDTPFYVIVYWSLVVELEFYLLVACLLIIRNQISQRLAIFVGMLLGSISVFTPPNLLLTFLPFWCDFFCGVLLFTALLAKYNKKTIERNFSLYLIIVFGNLSILVDRILYNNQIWFSSIFALILYLLYFVDDKINEFKLTKWLKYIGMISYSLYLLHVPFQGRVINLGLRFISTDSPMVLCLQILGWSVAIVVSYIFYRLVEKPLNSWRHRQKLLNAP